MSPTSYQTAPPRVVCRVSVRWLRSYRKGGIERLEGSITALGERFRSADRRLEPQPVDGLLGTVAPFEIDVIAGKTVEVTLFYDTGIR